MDRDKALLMRVRASAIMAGAHIGQIDEGGTPYQYHPVRVAKAFGYGLDPSELYYLYINENDEEVIRMYKLQTVALLHDVIEDTHITFADLRNQKAFTEEILSAIDAISKRDGEDYLSYIKRVKANELARNVKIAELKDNMQVHRLKELTEEDFIYLQEYNKTYHELKEGFLCDCGTNL